MTQYLTRRNGAWHFARKVPVEYRHLDKRNVVKHSTKVKIAKDRAGVRAAVVADEFNRNLEAYWRGLANGFAQDTLRGYEDARRRADMIGFSYVENKDLVAGPIEEQVARLKVLATPELQDDPGARDALLGLVEKPAFKLSNLFNEFFGQVQDEIQDLSPAQLKLWKRGKERALELFVGVVGDMDITKLNRGHALAYRKFWVDRVASGEVVAKSANKDIGQLNRMLKKMTILRELKLPDLFHGLRLEGEEDKDPTPYETKFIQRRILSESGLAGMNDDERGIIYVIADTGLRPSEIVNLNGSTIHLHAKIPYVEILPEGRRPKTKDSIRTIPLVGAALAALRRHPNGFPRYIDNSNGFSAAANKFLAENNLRPTEDHTVYSLRHSFKDRLIAAEAPDSLIDALMGHKTYKPKYGKGPTLALKLKFLQKTALRPPSSWN